MKNYSTFAASIISKSGIIRLMLAAGIFYACTLQSIYGFVPPCGVVNAPTALGVIDSGKGGTVFISAVTNNFLRDMSITEKTCLRAKHSTPQSTSFHETEIQLQQANSLPEISKVLITLCEQLGKKTELHVHFVVINENHGFVGNINGESNLIIGDHNQLNDANNNVSCTISQENNYNQIQEG